MPKNYRFAEQDKWLSFRHFETSRNIISGNGIMDDFGSNEISTAETLSQDLLIESHSLTKL